MATRPLQSDIDSRVIAAAQSGDEQAHAAIYAHYSSRLFTSIYRLVPRRAQAEDLLQEVFLEVLRGVAGYTGQGSFGGWLHRIAVNRCLMHLRSPWRQALEWLDDLPQETVETKTLCDPTYEGQSEIESALQQLPALSRAVVWLHDVEGFTHTEIGNRFGRTASFSKSQLARAHARLRELLVNRNEASSCTPATHSLSPSS